MQTLNQFKTDNGITSLDFIQMKGRAFAETKGKRVLISKTCDLTKTLYVIPLNSIDKESGETLPVENGYLVVNSDAKAVATL
jgi:hypothetical protein